MSYVQLCTNKDVLHVHLWLISPERQWVWWLIGDMKNKARDKKARQTKGWRRLNNHKDRTGIGEEKKLQENKRKLPLWVLGCYIFLSIYKPLKWVSCSLTLSHSRWTMLSALVSCWPDRTGFPMESLSTLSAAFISRDGTALRNEQTMPQTCRPVELESLYPSPSLYPT